MNALGNPAWVPAWVMVTIAAVALAVMLEVFRELRAHWRQRMVLSEKLIERSRRNHFLHMEHDAEMILKMEAMLHVALRDELAAYSLEHKRSHLKRTA